MSEPECTWHKIGDAWLGNRTGLPIDPQQMVEELGAADYSHLPELQRSED